MAEDTLDFISSCLDEIALEGLDGITISTLWIRLQDRPHFPIALDDKSKIYIWNCIVSLEEIEFFELPSPRPPLQLFNRYEHIDMEIGVVIESDNMPEDIYPFKEISENGIRGSCATFHSRKNVTSEIRQNNKLPHFKTVADKWGEKLVLVASQKARNKALMGTEVNPILDITDFQYCMLERIGRSRYQGEITLGKSGLNVMKAGTLHYYYTSLIRKNLVVKQVHYQKSASGYTHNSNLLHLPRFYVERLSKMEVMMNEISKALMKKPNHREACDVLKQELGMTKGSTFKKIMNHQKLSNPCFKTEIIPYRTFYPNSTKEEYMTVTNKEKFVRVIELVKPYHEDADDQERDDDEYEDCDKDVGTVVDVVFDPSNHVFDRPLLHLAYKLIEASGPDGITADELRRKLTLPKLDARFLLRCLVRKNSVITIMQDVGKQRVTKYMSKYFRGESDQCQKAMKEGKQILEMSQACKSAKADQFSMCKIEKISVATDKKSGSVVFEEQYNTETNKNKISFTKNVEQLYDINPEQQSQITYRVLKRANIIIQAVKSAKLIEGTSQLQKLILKEEAKEGVRTKIDKKSLLRIINKLAKDNYVRFIKTVLKHGNEEKNMHLICDPSVSVDDPLVKQIIEQAKFRYFRIPEDKEDKMSTQNEETEASIKESVKQFKMLCYKNTKKTQKYIPSMGRIYGLEAKFTRMKTLHEFLFYLVYDYKGIVPKDNPNTGKPVVYNDCKTWKMFVPPITKHSVIQEGWCFLSDIFLCMPLSVFIKIVNITYKIEGLIEYLNDPVKRHYLISQLPHDLKSALLLNRRFLFAVHETATRLSFMGLLSFGPQKMKEKDKVFVYIHRHTRIKDSTLSSPGYIHISNDIEYPVKEYHLDVLDTVEAFWLDLQSVCFRTPLGTYLYSQGQSVTIINVFRKPEMIEASRNHNFDEVKDTGIVPGDGLGAAGLDSALFAHLKRNWTWPTAQNKIKLNDAPENCQNQQNESCIGKNYMQYLVQSKDKSAENPYLFHRLRLQRLNQKILGTQMSTPLKNRSKEKKPQHQKVRKRKIIVEKEFSVKRSKKDYYEIRTISRNYSKPKKPYYDEKDKSALKNMSKMRVDWSPQEDSFLLLCKVASCFMDPNFPKMVVPYTVVRDMLLKHLPDAAKNKTSRACQRRVRYMLLNPSTASNVSVFVGEAKQNSELVKQCQKPMPPKTNEEEWTKMFVKVVHLLLTKFTSTTQRPKTVHLPKSFEEFHKYYKINMADSLLKPKCLHKDPKNLTDISFSVLCSIVLSSLSTQGDKVNWSYILYKIYQQYSETLLQSVLTYLKKESIITRSKLLRKRGVLSHIPYILSIKYKNFFKTRYTPVLFNEAHELFIQLSSNIAEDSGVHLDGEIKPGYCALVLSLLATDSLKFDIQIPDQIILFDSQLSKQQRSKLIQQMKHLNPENESAASFFAESSETNAEGRDSKKICLAKDVAKRNIKELSPIPEISDLEDISESGDGKEYDYSTSENSKNKLQKAVKSASSNKLTNINIELPAPTNASRFALYMLRQEFTQAPEERAQHSQDYFVINSCVMHCKLMNGKEPIKFSDSFALLPNEHSIYKSHIRDESKFVSHKNLPLSKDIINAVINSQKEYIPGNAFSNQNIESAKLSIRSAYHIYTDTEVEVAENIYCFINEKREDGITYKNLLEKYTTVPGSLKLSDHLKILTSQYLLLKGGITSVRYIAMSFAKPWIVSSFTIPREYRDHAAYVAMEDKQQKAQTKENFSQSTSFQEVQNSSYNSSRNETFPSLFTECRENTVNLDNVLLSDSEQLSKKTETSEKTDVEDLQRSNIPDVCTSIKSTIQGHNSVHNTRRRIKSKEKIKKTSILSSVTKNVHFAGRIWRKPDGSLNRPNLQKMLILLLGYILSYPGTTEKQICDHFTVVLPPNQTVEILELLEQSLCIRRFILRCSRKPSLFGSSTKREVVGDMLPTDIVHFEPAVDAMAKLSQLCASLIIKH